MKTVKELSCKVDELSKIVKHLQQEIKVLKAEKRTEYVTHAKENGNNRISFNCHKCGSKFGIYKQLTNHIKIAHQKTIKCGLCNYEGTQISDI